MEKISLENVDIKATKKSKPNLKSKKAFSLPALFTLVIIGGLFTGISLARNNTSSTPQVADSGPGLEGSPDSADSVTVGTLYGSADSDTFRDSAEGILVEGGIEGEGSHHLVRLFQDPVYLTSSVVDLDQFVGHRLEVWGETFDARHAGWLMDVGKLKVLELNAEIVEE